MTIFSLAAVFVGVIAWFQMERVFNGGDDFEVNNITGRLKKVTFHTLNSKETNSAGIATSFSFNKDYVGSITYDWSTRTGTYVPVTEGDAAIELDDYDPMDQEKPILVLFEYDKEYNVANTEHFVIDAISSEDDFLGERDPSTNMPIHPLSETYKGTVDNNPYYALSSVANFYNASLSTSQFNTLNGGSYFTFYKQVQTPEQNKVYLNNSDNFVYVNNDTNVSSFDDDGKITIAEYDTGNIQYIAIVIDYYIDAVEYIYSTFLGDTTLEDTYDYYLRFACDWSLEVL